MPPSSCTRSMLRLRTRSRCFPEASIYSPRQVPDRSWREGADVVESIVSVAGRVVASGMSVDGAAAGSAPELWTAGDGATDSVDVDVCVAVEACAGGIGGSLEGSETSRGNGC